MARGRQQKWICLDCGAAFAVQGIAPKMAGAELGTGRKFRREAAGA